MRKHIIKNTITKRTKLFTCWVASNNNNNNSIEKRNKIKCYTQIYIALFAKN